MANINSFLNFLSLKSDIGRCLYWWLGVKRTVRPVPLAVPHFQLVQTFQQLSRAICHGERPAELARGRFVHLRLYFSLSHDECPLQADPSRYKQSPCAVRTPSCPADCSSSGCSCSSAPGRTFPNMGCNFLHPLLVEVSRAA